MERREKRRPFAGVETKSSRQPRGKCLWAATGAMEEKFVGAGRGAAYRTPKAEWGVTNAFPCPGHEGAVAVRFLVRKVSHS